MVWDDVDLDNGTIHLRETKTGIERYVQLSGQAIDLLKILSLSPSVISLLNIFSHTAIFQLSLIRQTFSRLMACGFSLHPHVLI